MCVTWGQVESLSLYYIYFLQIGFPVYRLVLGSSKRAKEEIGIAELRAAQRPSIREQWEDTRCPFPLCPHLPAPPSLRPEQDALLLRNLAMPLASGKRFFDGELMRFLFLVDALFVVTEA